MLYWIVITIMMIILLFIKSSGYTPVSAFGMALGAIACKLFQLTAAANAIQFKPEQFMYLLLPPIVLCSGLKFKWNRAIKTIGTSMVFAWLGTIGTAGWVGVGLWSYSNLEPWIVAFWIGSILSPTDPVGTLDIMKNLQGNEEIRLVLEHESLLNDAVAVMLVHMSRHAWEAQKTITKIESMEIFGMALGLACISCFIGCLGAWLVQKHQEAALVTVVGMFLFSVSEFLGASGIISLFVFGACLSAFGLREDIYKTIEYIADLSEMYVYVTMGSVITMIEWKYSWIGVNVIIACIVGRIINVFILGYLVRIGGVTWSMFQLIFMSTCGMRGAVSLALAVYTPEPLKDMFVTITVMEVVFSMLYTSITNSFLIKYIDD